MVPFEYRRAADVQDAVKAHQGDARYLAGGQSLIQAMKLRLSQPDRLIDLSAARELAQIRVEQGRVVIGAMARHADVAGSVEVAAAIPALAELAAGIGDPAVRHRGTLGGSVANADPAACYPAALLALQATVHTDRRSVAADHFFTGLYETALDEGELITAVAFPVPQRAAYVKLKQPASRFALVGVFVSQAAGGVRVAVTGARSHVYRCTAVEAALERSFTYEAARSVAPDSAGINADLHASAAYRAAMIPVMAARAVERALGR
jgi:carbon-monoxide dehydrogenase medium subunit